MDKIAAESDRVLRTEGQSSVNSEVNRDKDKKGVIAAEERHPWLAGIPAIPASHGAWGENLVQTPSRRYSAMVKTPFFTCTMTIESTPRPLWSSGVMV